MGNECSRGTVSFGIFHHSGGKKVCSPVSWNTQQARLSACSRPGDSETRVLALCTALYSDVAFPTTLVGWGLRGAASRMGGRPQALTHPMTGGSWVNLWLPVDTWPPGSLRRGLRLGSLGDWPKGSAAKLYSSRACGLDSSRVNESHGDDGHLGAWTLQLWIQTFWPLAGQGPPARIKYVERKSLVHEEEEGGEEPRSSCVLPHILGLP